MFPLLRLPAVALGQVSHHLELDILVILSLCSQRMQSVLKPFNKKRETKIRIVAIYSFEVVVVFTYGDCSIAIGDYVQPPFSSQFEVHETSELPKNGEFETFQIGNRAVAATKKTEIGFNVLKLYFDSKAEGFKVFLDYVTTFLDRPIYKLDLGHDFLPNQIRDIIKWTLTKQRALERLRIMCEPKVFRDILDVCSLANFLNLDFKTSKKFRHEFSFKNEQISLVSALWFSLNNLLAINCRYCQINLSNLTSQEVNQFLKHWIAGGNNKIKEMYIGMKDINLEVLLSDLNAVPFPEGVVRKYIDAYNEEVEISYGFDIQRNDGVLATIRNGGVYVIRSPFWMVVWD